MFCISIESKWKITKKLTKEWLKYDFKFYDFKFSLGNGSIIALPNIINGNIEHKCLKLNFHHS
ncbi:hypothetical protein DU71_13695 [Methanosarcina mazei]|uniref:Uncharacterized protein n=1 Tax=Methanosarcina mazei TaxID=2209 RepID=A0A0F8MJF9_METMZ|nr:hypothetical protein DU71_13695 [Methanosarcina mazei]KKH45775.1 hypothetical protein DU72_00900 [Methanosarcina mazei]